MPAKTIDVPDLVIRLPVPCSNCPGVASYQYTDHWMCQDCGSTGDLVWGYLDDPHPFTWKEFLREWECACVDAWDAGRQEPTVTLPLNVFPGVTSVRNSCTGNLIEITRSSPFDWDDDEAPDDE